MQGNQNTGTGGAGTGGAATSGDTSGSGNTGAQGGNGVGGTGVEDNSGRRLLQVTARLCSSSAFGRAQSLATYCMIFTELCNSGDHADQRDHCIHLML